jgi:hypothetical protein
MNRRTFFTFGVSTLAVSVIPLLAMVDDDKGNKHGRKHGQDDGRDENGRGHGNGNQGKHFRQEDAMYLRENYGGPMDLPPGLRKKYYRTGKLPPGWEKRFRPFPPAVIQRLPPPPPNCERGYVDGYAVVYDRRTRVILDLIDLVNVATNR